MGCLFDDFADLFQVCFQVIAKSGSVKNVTPMAF